MSGGWGMGEPGADGVFEGTVDGHLDGGDAGAAGGFEVGGGVAEEDGVAGDEAGVIAEGLEQEAGGGFAAIAGALVVGADVDGVEDDAGEGELALHLGMQGGEGGGAQLAEGDGALVGDDEEAEAGRGEELEAGRGAGEKLKLARGQDVVEIGVLVIEHAVAVEESGPPAGSGDVGRHAVPL